MKKELWLRLKHYRFEHVVPPQLMDHVTAAFGRTDASTKAFASKLSRKLGWTTAFSLRAIEEYRKFLYLGALVHALHRIGVRRRPCASRDGRIRRRGRLYGRRGREFLGRALLIRLRRGW